MTTPADLERQGRLGAAARAWAAAGDAVGLARAARLHARLGRLDLAAAALDRARALGPDTDDVRLATAALALHRGRPADAEAAAGAVAPDAAPDVRADALGLLAEAAEARGRLDEAQRLLADAAPAGADARRAVRLRVARLLVGTGDPGAVRAVQALVADARAAGDAPTEADALTALGRALVDRRDYARAWPAHQGALALHGRTGDRLGAAASLGGLGLCRLGTRAVAEAASHLQRAVSLCAEAGAPAAEAAWRTHLDEVLVLLDRAEWRARELERFVAIVRELDDPVRLVRLLRALGDVHTELLRPDRAEPWYAEAAALAAAL
jgi:tetratricopeptide (TPR) repeat protein